jgi:hypothetical protein
LQELRHDRDVSVRKVKPVLNSPDLFNQTIKTQPHLGDATGIHALIATQTSQTNLHTGQALSLLLHRIAHSAQIGPDGSQMLQHQIVHILSHDASPDTMME